ncbi:MAG: GTPase Era [Anaerolineae bacterium]
MDEQGGLLFGEELPPDHRSGFVALVGKPNVGKSTLLNAWLGQKVAAVSPKPQTTRNRLLGILTRPDAQAIFVDTPGIHLPRTKLGDYMVNAAKQAIPDADVVLFLVDVSEPPDEADRQIAQLMAGSKVPVVMVQNKIDLVPEEEREAKRATYAALGDFETTAISALAGEDRDALLERVIGLLPTGPRYYPEDQLTDQEERFIAAELVREQILKLLSQEVPHAVAVVVQDFKERTEDLLYISATIYTEKDSQKGIVIGAKGATLKRIGRDARAELESFFERKVYLELWVKVRKNWRRDDQQLRQFGYTLPKDR